MWTDPENKIISFADNTSFYLEGASPSDHINVANSLNRDLVKIQSWHSKWGMKFDTCKTHLITISQSRTHQPATQILSILCIYFAFF